MCRKKKKKNLTKERTNKKNKNLSDLGQFRVVSPVKDVEEEEEILNKKMPKSNYRIVKVFITQRAKTQSNGIRRERMEEGTMGR